LGYVYEGAFGKQFEIEVVVARLIVVLDCELEALVRDALRVLRREVFGGGLHRGGGARTLDDGDDKLL
jgi:hypothetical protein